MSKVLTKRDPEAVGVQLNEALAKFRAQLARVRETLPIPDAAQARSVVAPGGNSREMSAGWLMRQDVE